MPVVNGNRLCGKRDEGYNFLTTTKTQKVFNPTKNINTYTCLNEGTPKLCGIDGDDEEYVLCIPKGSQCPITKVWFNGDQTLQTSTESSHYPITDLVLSQGGKPCVHYQKD